MNERRPVLQDHLTRSAPVPESGGSVRRLGLTHFRRQEDLIAWVVYRREDDFSAGFYDELVLHGGDGYRDLDVEL
jgi:hypothetical protein